jgi:membrane protein implicated in regulation of membrane protease activity
MDIMNTSRSADTGSATAEKKRNVALSGFAGGLSAWLGGVAFCVGFGVVAPTWVALAVTVLSATAAALSHMLLRRTERTADRPTA